MLTFFKIVPLPPHTLIPGSFSLLKAPLKLHMRTDNQIQNETVSISFHFNALEKGMNSSILLLAMSKL